MPPATDRARLMDLARANRLLTASQVAAAGIHSHQLTRLVAQGWLERVARGRYRVVDSDTTEQHSLVVAAAAAPHGVICLLSALGLHGIGTQLPPEVWIAIPRGTRPPRVSNFKLRVVTFSGAAFTEGIETHTVEHQKVRVYSVAKTIADLFKARNRIGIDVAMEALREAWRDRRFAMDDLDRAARACRVERVMRPYVEGIVA